MISPSADAPTSPASAASPTPHPAPNTAPLSDVLERIGLGHYYSVLVDNGFTTWDTILDITEDDLTQLKFKLGHRRLLQREIATSRGLPSSYSLEVDGSSSTPPTAGSAADGQAPNSRGREKRRYRRHPRPDNNAPKKPKTAYVNFADHLRTDPAISSLSFVDIAKEVGRRWQELPAEQKRMWENQAARANHEYEVQMDEYKKTDLYRKYQQYLEAFKAQQTQAKAGNRVSTVSTPFPRRELSCGSPSSSDSPLPQAFATATEAETCHNALTLAFSELVVMRGAILTQNASPYNDSNLPPEEPIRRALHAALKASSLFYMWTYPQIDLILDKIYRPEKPVDAMTLAECFTVAAIGAHYDHNCFSDQTRRVLYASGTLQFNEKTARMDYFRTARILLSMAFYAWLEKQMNARCLVGKSGVGMTQHSPSKNIIAAGLQIARWKYATPHQSPRDGARDMWKRIFRSLIFVDSWFCILGYPSEVITEDIVLATSPSSDPTTIEDAIHIHSMKIGLIAAAITTASASAELSSREAVTHFQRKLESWRHELPHILQLSSLSQQSLHVDQRKAIVIFHSIYLGALTLLYRNQLLAAAEAKVEAIGSSWIADPSPDESSECGAFAQQVAQVLHVVYDGTSTKHGWITIYAIFSISIVLIFSALSKLLDGSPEAADEYLIHAKGCLSMLESCSYETLSRNYVDILRPLYDNLRDMHQRTVGRVKTSIFSLLQPTGNTTQRSPPVPLSKAEVRPMLNQLNDLIKNPVWAEPMKSR